MYECSSDAFGMYSSCRIEETRTPDPYVPNVVRYQLRYYPMASLCENRCKVTNKNANSSSVSHFFCFSLVSMGFSAYLCTRKQVMVP